MCIAVCTDASSLVGGSKLTLSWLGVKMLTLTFGNCTFFMMHMEAVINADKEAGGGNGHSSS